jgi:hypothetical protein
MTLYKFLLQFSFLFIVFLGSTFAGADPSKKAHPALKVHGDELPNSCSSIEKDKLQKILISEINKNSDSNGAWRLVETLLCASDTKNDRLLLQSSLPSKIRLTASASGEKDVVRWVKRDSELIDSLMAKGQAWNATFEVSSNRLKLQFNPDEACIRTRTIQFLKGKWNLVAISEACD